MNTSIGFAMNGYVGGALAFGTQGYFGHASVTVAPNNNAITGRLSERNGITGTIAERDAITGTLSERDGIDGDISEAS